MANYDITTYLDMAQPVLTMCHQIEKEMIYVTLNNLGSHAHDLTQGDRGNELGHFGPRS